MITWIVHTIFYGSCMIFSIPNFFFFRGWRHSLARSLYTCTPPPSSSPLKKEKSILLLLNQSCYLLASERKKNSFLRKEGGSQRKLRKSFTIWMVSKEKQFWIIYGTCHTILSYSSSFLIFLYFIYFLGIDV